MQELAAEEERKKRHEEEQEQERYREEVRRNMVTQEESRKRSIVSKRKEKEYHLMSAQQRREEDLRYRREMEFLKRLDRQETVERIQRIQEYEREKVKEKIVMDDVRSYQLKEEKQNLLQARREMRSQADKKKQEMQQAFERMQLKGTINVRTTE